MINYLTLETKRVYLWVMALVLKNVMKTFWIWDKLYKDLFSGKKPRNKFRIGVKPVLAIHWISRAFHWNLVQNR